MRDKYGQERRAWVMDRGMVSEDNLEMLREAGASYLVGTPQSMLKRFERELVADDWTHIESGVDVKLCTAPDGATETYVLCCSPQRSQKNAPCAKNKSNASKTNAESVPCSPATAAPPTCTRRAV